MCCIAILVFLALLTVFEMQLMTGLGCATLQVVSPLAKTETVHKTRILSSLREDQATSLFIETCSSIYCLSLLERIHQLVGRVCYLPISSSYFFSASACPPTLALFLRTEYILSVSGFHLLEVLGLVSSSIRSTCSKVKPLVSGTSRYAYTRQTAHKAPQTKNTLCLRLPLSGSIIGGVMAAMTAFQNQLDAVLIATPRARMGRLKISPVRTHATVYVLVSAAMLVYQ